MKEHSVNDEHPRIIQIDPMSQADPSENAQCSVFMPVDTDDSIPLDFPREVQSSDVLTGNRTEPLPSRTTVDSPRNRERSAFTAPLPVVPVSGSIPIPHTMSVPLNDSSPRPFPHKSAATGFPMLPAPSPLRKSMRVTQDAPASSVLPTIAPAPVLLGKRTSWLMKAREAKAMEGTSSLPGTSVTAISTALPRIPIAVKRKSGEMLGTLPPGPDMDIDQRLPKIAKSIEAGIVPLVSQEIERAIQRDFPSVQDETIALSSIVPAMSVDHSGSHAMDVDKQVAHLNSAEEGFIDLFKRTVEGLGARAGRGMGKSLGGAAVAALAEARAAAEARVAERNKANSESNDSEALRDDTQPEQKPLETQVEPDTQIPHTLHASLLQAEGTERRLSLSDLVPDAVQSNKPELPTKMAQARDGGSRINSGDESVSTTPPDSPPLKGSSGFVKPAGPVFNKPPPQPVFMPPVSKQSAVTFEHPKEFLSNFPSGQFALPAAVSLGIPARLVAPSDGFPPLVQGSSKMSAPSSQSSVFSDSISDKRNGVPTWEPSAQENLRTIDSHPRDLPLATTDLVDDDGSDDDDDDSWPLEEKLAAAEPGWRPFDFSNVDKEDTWSSLPTESQGPTRRLTTEIRGDTIPLPNDTNVEGGTKNDGVERVQETVEIPDVGRSILDTRELEEVTETRAASLDSVDLGVRTLECSATVYSIDH